MKTNSLKKLVPIIALLSTPIFAEQYQSFTDINYTKYDVNSIDTDNYGISSIYYFEKRESLGPLNEFEYINKFSNVSAGYLNGDFSDSYNVMGELFLNNFLIGASYNKFSIDNNSDIETYQASLGYLISDNFLIKTTAIKTEDSDTFFLFSADYNVQLNKNDYLGFSYSTDDDFDSHLLSSKYFKALSQGRYLTANISYNYISGDNFSSRSIWSADMDYYFNKNTSIFAGYTDGENNLPSAYSLGASHFFNKNYSVKASYNSTTSSNDIVDYNIYSLSFIAQF